MYRKILVPVDGTPDAERVLEWVKPFARLGADIHLVTVVDSHHLAESYEFAQMSESLTEWADQYLAELVESVQSEFPSTEGTRGMGSPAREIMRIAGEVEADLIAMETHRGSAVVRGIIGSCTDAVIRSGALPVLVLPPGAASIQPPEKPESILVPLDGSPLAENGLETAAELAEAFGASISLLRAASAPIYGGGVYGMESANVWDQAIEAQRKEASDYLDRMASRLKLAGHSVSSRVANDAGANAIIEALDDSPSTMAVMATHGRGGIKRLVLGSVTDKVVRSSQAPILVLPANALEGDDARTDY